MDLCFKYRPDGTMVKVCSSIIEFCCLMFPVEGNVNYKCM